MKPVNKGVAKLGWSWEALDVRKWTDSKTLQSALVDLGEQQVSMALRSIQIHSRYLNGMNIKILSLWDTHKDLHDAAFTFR